MLSFNLLVSAHQVMDENADFQFSQIYSRAHSRSTAKSKKAESLNWCLPLEKNKLFPGVHLESQKVDEQITN